MKKLDILTLCLVLAFCGVLFTFDFPKKGALSAEVTVSGEVLFECELGSLNEPLEKTFGDVKIRFEKDGACFVDSDCKDKLCIKRKMLTHPGDTMACLPNKVVLSLKSSKSSVDVITY